MPSAPRTSVLMPAYNAVSTVKHALRSVLDQSDEDLEVIVVDDGSTDETFLAALSLRDPRVRVFQIRENSGAAAARNHALRQAHGRYIAFLDADDLWLPGKLEAQIAAMQNSGIPLSYTGFYRDNGRRRKTVSVPPKVTYAQLLRGNVIGCLTAIYDSEVFGKSAMPDIRLRQDFALWLDLLKRTDHAIGLQKPYAVHFRNKGSLSSNVIANAVGTWYLYREFAQKSPLESAGYMASHYLNRLRSIG